MNSNQLRRRREKSSISPLSIAFAVGAAVGAGVALVMTPHSGGEMRRRIASGAKTAQEQLSGVVEETVGAVGALTKDARQTLRHTALRLTNVVSATKDAFQADAGVPERMSADE
jgi:gas vesicle protein